jgi:exopolyphosphatase/guanosine-5'-triphosphate,3'-diphosphate pyrophosphatase
LKFAAIDIGSNAIRLLLMNVFESDDGPVYRKDSLFRVALRLGEESFMDKRISEKKSDKFVDTMKAFNILMKVHDVKHYKACATAAMREAENGYELIDRVKEEADINIEIVSGKEEAEIIYGNNIVEYLDHEKNYLYIDVGGGSTELSLFHGKELIASRSFPIGTLKILNNQVNDEDWEFMKEWLAPLTKKYKRIYGIGSGGNINKLYKLYSDSKSGMIKKTDLENAFEDLTGSTFYERIKNLGLRPDRADVIIPAAEIFINICNWAGINNIYVPKFGVSDGLIHLVYQEYKSVNN